MARRPTQQERIAALLERFSPEIRDAFLASVQDITSRARLGAIVTALENGDVEGALRAINVEPAAFLPLEQAIRGAYVEGGTAVANAITRVEIRFDVRNIVAETWLARHSSDKVVEIVDDQRDAIRTQLDAGMQRGDNPRTVALDIIGRIGVSGRREGGIVGLTSQAAGYVANARADLLSGDEAQMRRYFDRARRDKRFDGIVLRAIKDGKALDAATVTRLTNRYADRLLALRGATIGRTEAMASLNRAEYEAYRQAAEKGAISARSVRKTWLATKPEDGRTRDSHRRMHGETVGLNERFSNGLLHPGDPDGAAEEVIACRCRQLFRIDRLSNLE